VIQRKYGLSPDMCPGSPGGKIALAHSIVLRYMKQFHSFKHFIFWIDKYYWNQNSSKTLRGGEKNTKMLLVGVTSAKKTPWNNQSKYSENPDQERKSNQQSKLWRWNLLKDTGFQSHSSRDTRRSQTVVAPGRNKMQQQPLQTTQTAWTHQKNI